MEAKFTKGPWHKSGWKSAEVSVGIPGAEKIEIRSSTLTWGVASVYIVREGDREIQEANAALIAAAPELEEALFIDETLYSMGYTQKACKWLLAHGIEPPLQGELARWASEKRRGALAKARSETSLEKAA